ncbi:MAG: AMP-dependent synthetase/ligase [Blastocatellia bacterium]
MNFIENILRRLRQTPARPVLQEAREGKFVTVTCEELGMLVRQARTFIRQSGLRKGDRCGLLAPNDIRWAAADLALMAEGVIVVPLYSRQAPNELAGMLGDCAASMVLCGDEALAEGLRANWPDASDAASPGGAPHIRLFYDIFDATIPDRHVPDEPIPLAEGDISTIIYTSGTSGEPKGVMLTAGNVGFMLGCTGMRLDQLMRGATEQTMDQVFHYLPFCFAGSWILLLTALSRNSLLTMSTDLNKLADELKLAAPNYCLNVPTLLERIRAGVEGQIARKPGPIQTIYRKGKESWTRRFEQGEPGGGLWFTLADSLIFSSVKKKIGPNLKALICGSAPLARETQLFFLMLGIPVLQVYGLTETTAICTMDDPRDFTPGRVGPAIPGIEMRLGEEDEILVRGPNIFAGYWNREEASASAMAGGWFRTGDQGSVDDQGNWAITGRLKNLIILKSGNNVAPEPIEEKVLQHLPLAGQCVVIGDGRSFLAALVTGEVTREQVGRALDAVNAEIPHYKQIHAFHIHEEPLTIESGMLTANGKLRRDAIARRFAPEFEQLYSSSKPAERA